MPPAPSTKGTGKKGAGAKVQRSRNTTPITGPPPGTTTSIPPVETIDAEFLEIKLESIRSITYEDLADSNASNAVIPDSKSLDGLITRLGRLHEIIENRGSNCDKGMRLVAGLRKAHFDEMAASSRRDDEKMRDDEDRDKRANKKKRKANDSLAPQETNTDRSSPLRESSSKPRKLSRDSTSSSLSPVAKETPSAMEVDEKAKLEDKDDDESSSEDEGAPPRREAPQFQTFGEDPSTFPDPTVYEIRPTNSSMTTDELKEIFSVAVYPETDLADQIAGDPPDKDFSNGKASNQINFSSFTTYVDPYFRPFAEEDLAFLRERGDRFIPFVMPKRGKRHYSEIWAEEDGAMSIDSSPQGRDKLPPNQARGSIDNIDDDVAETDKLSVGPILSRLLMAMRPEARAPPAEDKVMTNGVNGDAETKDEAAGEPSGPTNGEENKSLPPASFMPESSSEAWKKATHPKLDYNQVDERIKQELRHIGFLPQEGFEGDYDGHYDDEVAARLRLLQERLKDQMLINGARKARLTELVKERMAHQEYQTILEDLDTQVQGAYLKRTRTMGKSKKAKRPGGAGGGSHPAGSAAAGMARPGIGDVTKTLMERRRRWIENIGTVFDDENLGKVPRATDPDSTIFKPAMMAELMKAERQAWDEEVEEE
ncbi:histone acetyltransferases subunit 3-domain-containing protein [Pseudomassariella vexata]|uniref:Histone acetyltransferases subunit 3-domain-containing protein n=1 Tax=Pseudomassariella vexata TaxID=1141098 RepID=A0A1Y2DD73_9PEZI|nr:histone acetyltransferases subunit 3-domain-containing protein [Pseudomassariella vexata]ORY57208.1 histone acetyltransferases subunit 3-domain-containing protein [Pseudomassariella vexata]